MSARDGWATLMREGDRVFLRPHLLTPRGSWGEVVAEDGELLAVRWPAGKHFAGRFMDRAYHPAETTVFTVTQRLVDQVKLQVRMSWEHTRRRK